MVFKSGDECDRCHQIVEYQSTYLKHRKNYQCYKEDKLSTCLTCGNDFQNKYLLANHNKKFHTLKECLNCGKQITAASFSKHMLRCENMKEITFNCGAEHNLMSFFAENCFRRKSLPPILSSSYFDSF